jgi:hypothetical protein
VVLDEITEVTPSTPAPKAGWSALSRKQSGEEFLHDYAREVLVNERLFVLDYVTVLQFAHHVDFFLGSLIKKGKISVILVDYSGANLPHQWAVA